jgi:DNA-binding CsgD family transcriptional regulator
MSTAGRQGDRANADVLTPRQLDVLRLIADGLTADAVARRLGIGLVTVRAHLLHVRQALGARSTTHAVAIAVRTGVIE